MGRYILASHEVNEEGFLVLTVVQKEKLYSFSSAKNKIIEGHKGSLEWLKNMRDSYSRAIGYYDVFKGNVIISKDNPMVDILEKMYGSRIISDGTVIFESIAKNSIDKIREYYDDYDSKVREKMSQIRDIEESSEDSFYDVCCKATLYGGSVPILIEDAE